jgi:hypothetical protein
MRVWYMEVALALIVVVIGNGGIKNKVCETTLRADAYNVCVIICRILEILLVYHVKICTMKGQPITQFLPPSHFPFQ